VASHIYLTAVGVPVERARLLVEALKERSQLELFVDPSAGGTSISEFHYTAAGVVVLWGDSQDTTTYETNSAIRATKPTVIVRMTAGVPLPETIRDLAVVDLANWAGGDHEELDRLISQLEVIANLNRLKADDTGGQLSSWTSSRASDAIGDLVRLSAEVRRLDVVLANDKIQSVALDSTLREIAETYRVVHSAVEQFIAAGMDPKGIDGQAFVFLERGSLAERIHNGRAHCLRIGARYYREGGIRQVLEASADAQLLQEADAAFAELTSSDMDMLASLDDIGRELTQESRTIVTLLLAGQDQEARQRIAGARETLRPLEQQLDNAISSFQHHAASLGYAENRAPEKEVIQMTTTNIHIGGGNTNCNIVVADTIKESSITAAAPGVPEELRQVLTDLHKAVADLTTHLPDDEAELAASDLKNLTREATSGHPKAAQWKRATNGLLDAAAKVATAGLPVVELVTKLSTLLA